MPPDRRMSASFPAASPRAGARPAPALTAAGHLSGRDPAVRPAARHRHVRTTGFRISAQAVPGDFGPFVLIDSAFSMNATVASRTRFGGRSAL